MEKTIAIDMDGVLVDLYPTWVQRYNKATGSDLKPAELTTWDLRNHIPEENVGMMMELLFEEDLFSDLPVIDGAKEAIARLEELGFKIIILTHAWDNNINILSGKVKWLKKHFPQLLDDAIFCKNKSFVHTEFIVDDAVHHISGHPANHAFLMKASHNKSQHTWETIIKAIEKVMSNGSVKVH
jgi:5'(3')-deoxyribonucleotidase